MNKAKAAFAGAVVVAVAGASAVLWALNEHGLIGSEDSTVNNSYAEVQEEDGVNYYNNSDSGGNGSNYGDTNDDNDAADENEANDGGNGDEEQNNGGNGDNGDIQSDTAYEDINTFLSAFSLVYFAESDEGYSSSNYSTYELIRFAYSHIKRTSPQSLVTKESGDAYGIYSGVSYDDVNSVLSDYLGKTVQKESVYTEKSAAFFEYEDGYFYTPAADGLGFSDIIIADSVSDNGDTLSVAFTVYSSGAACDMTSQEAKDAGVKYGSGTAVLEYEDDNFVLTSYKINIDS
ncbi:MAG: hypothetical protein LUH40_00220 [Clostridiales bacterium]|nr:hypothetical protein [Clostridiales bacterium]